MRMPLPYSNRHSSTEVPFTHVNCTYWFSVNLSKLHIGYYNPLLHILSSALTIPLPCKESVWYDMLTTKTLMREVLSPLLTSTSTREMTCSVDFGYHDWNRSRVLIYSANVIGVPRIHRLCNSPTTSSSSRSHTNHITSMMTHNPIDMQTFEHRINVLQTSHVNHNSYY